MPGAFLDRSPSPLAARSLLEDWERFCHEPGEAEGGLLWSLARSSWQRRLVLAVGVEAQLRVEALALVRLEDALVPELPSALLERVVYTVPPGEDICSGSAITDSQPLERLERGAAGRERVSQKPSLRHSAASKIPHFNRIYYLRPYLRIFGRYGTMFQETLFTDT